MSNSEEQFSQLGVTVGSLIAERYEVCQMLGQGGMGVVFLVKDRQLDDRILALKLLHPRFAANKEVFTRFRNEVLVARTLSHPNIVRTHDIGEHSGDLHYITMEYIDGESLKAKIQKASADGPSGGLPFDEALSYFRQIVDGVAYAHAQGVVHRDLKPANVLITGTGQAKLADFGASRVIEMDAGLTQTGQIIGTPGYIAPEQLEGERGGVSSDIYALGTIAFELVVGRRPYEAETFVELAVKQMQEPFPEIGKLVPGIPKWYEEAVSIASARKKEQRFDSAASILTFLSKHAEPTSLRWAPESLPELIKKRLSRNIYMAVGAVLAGLIIVSLWPGKGEEVPKDTPLAGISKEVQLAGIDQVEAKLEKGVSQDIQEEDSAEEEQLRLSLEQELMEAGADDVVEDEQSSDPGDIVLAEAIDSRISDQAKEVVQMEQSEAGKMQATKGETPADVSKGSNILSSSNLQQRANYAGGRLAAIQALADLDAQQAEEDESDSEQEEEVRSDPGKRVALDRSFYDKAVYYSGTMIIGRASGTNQERVFTLDLGYRDESIEGVAVILGLGRFSVKGKEIPGKIVKVDLKLSGGGSEIRLEGEHKELGPKKDKALGGVAFMANGEKGTWRVDLIRKNIASGLRLRDYQ